MAVFLIHSKDIYIYIYVLFKRYYQSSIVLKRPRFIVMRLTPQRIRVKLNWLTQHRPNLFPIRLWRNVMFSDESRFLMYRADGRRRVYRRDGKRFRDNCEDEVDRFGGGGLMVWAGIAH